MRVTALCQMKLVIMKQFDKSRNLLTVTLNCHTDKNQCRFHNHTLEYLDSIKINSAIKGTAGKEVAKGHASFAVNRNMQEVKWAGNLDALKDAGRSHLDLMAVHNAGKDFKKSNPDVQIKEAKEDWEDQASSCFNALQALGENILSAQLKVSQVIDKQLLHGIVFARRCKFYYFFLLFC